MSTSAPPSTRARPVTRWGAGWVGVALLLLAAMAAWSLGTPLMASPDEPSHVARAAAVARGQWSGPLGPSPEDSSRPGAATVVTIPRDYGEALSLPNCFAFQPEVPASCQQDVEPPGPDVRAETFAGQYPPLYYVLVGWVSLVLPAGPGILAMRLLSAALAAALLTAGLHRLTTLGGNRAGPWGAAVALTPMCLFLGGTVNPAGFEIAAAFSFWAACLALVLGAGPVGRGALVHAAVAGALLVNSRSSGPLWALVAVVVALVAAPPGRWREVVRHPAFRGVVVAAVVAGGAAVAWLLTHASVVTTRGLFPLLSDPMVALLAVLGEARPYLENMVGDFGWLDAPAPPLTWMAWYAAVGMLVLLALALHGPRRPRVALALLVLGVAAAPVVLQVPNAGDTGLIWQGRYGLPAAVGVPLLAALAVRVDATPLGDALRRVARATLVLVAVAQVAAFYWGTRRYAEGLEGDLVTVRPDWSSPIGFLPGVAAYAVVVGAITAIGWRYLRPAPVLHPTGAVPQPSPVPRP